MTVDRGAALVCQQQSYVVYFFHDRCADEALEMRQRHHPGDRFGRSLEASKSQGGGYLRRCG